MCGGSMICRSVDENISKARHAITALGSIGSFQGVLNPLTGRSAFEVFVITVLLYGCETWILTPALLSKLEKLQSEIGKAPIIGLHQSTYSSTKNQFSCQAAGKCKR